MNKKLTIGIIQQSPDIGGAETYMFSLMKGFKQHNAKILFATDSQKLIKFVGSTPNRTFFIPVLLDVIGNWKGMLKAIVYFPFACIYYIWLLLQFKRNEVNVILMSGYSEKMLVTFLAPFFHIPVVWIEYGPLKVIFQRNFGFPYFLYKYLNKIPYTIITSSKNTKKSLVADAHIKPSHIQVIYLGVDVKTKKVKRKGKNVIIGNVSRATREKGQDVLIRAIPSIVKKNSNVRFIFVGRGPDLKYFKQLTKELDVEHYVEFSGFVKDLATYYSQMEVFVFPTVWPLEGFGLVSTEAMSWGIPVVASDTGPVPEIVQDGKTGILFEPGNSDELARAIITLLEDHGLRQKMGIAAQILVAQEFDIETNVKKVYDILTAAVEHEKQKSS